MADVNKLKNRARREEQRENWTRAIELYTQALEKSEKDRDSASDLSLYNRIGDIHLRLGDRGTAVECYEQAIARYAEQDLHTSAIALCNKVLRIMPGRVTIYRRLGRLHAATGLVAESRVNYLRFASELNAQGKVDEALEALEECAERTGDQEVTLHLAERLVERDRPAEALDRLRGLAERLDAKGEPADEVHRRIAELEASAGPTGVPPRSPADSLEDVEAELESLYNELAGAVADLAEEESAPAPTSPVGAEGEGIRAAPGDAAQELAELEELDALAEELEALGAREADDASPVPSPAEAPEVGVEPARPAGGGRRRSVRAEGSETSVPFRGRAPTALPGERREGAVPAGLRRQPEVDRERAEDAAVADANATADGPERSPPEPVEQPAAPSPAAAEARRAAPAAEPTEPRVSLLTGDPGLLLPDPADASVGPARGPAPRVPQRLEPGERSVTRSPLRSRRFTLEDVEAGASAEAAGSSRLAGYVPRRPAGPEPSERAGRAASVGTEPSEGPGLHGAGRPGGAVRGEHREPASAAPRAPRDPGRREGPEAAVAAPVAAGRGGLPTAEGAEQHTATMGEERHREAEQALGAGRVEEAARAFEEALESRAHFVSAWEGLSRCRAALGGVEEDAPEEADVASPEAAEAPLPEEAEAPPPEAAVPVDEGAMAEILPEPDPGGDDGSPRQAEADVPEPAGDAEESERQAFLEWVASAPAALLHRTLPELVARGELRRALTVADRLLHMGEGDEALQRRKLRLALELGDERAVAEAESALEDPASGPLSPLPPLHDREGADGPVRPARDAADEAGRRGGPSRPATPAEAADRPSPEGEEAPVSEAVDPEAAAEDRVRPYRGLASEVGHAFDFDELLSELKSDLVDAGPEDTASRTELGIHYMKMGLLDDAIRELQAAVREPSPPAQAFELLGEAFIEKGQPRVAARLLAEAVERSSYAEQQLLGVLYQLGLAYQQLGDRAEALACYERIFSVNIDYRDVNDRILACSA